MDNTKKVAKTLDEFISGLGLAANTGRVTLTASLALLISIIGEEHLTEMLPDIINDARQMAKDMSCGHELIGAVRTRKHEE